MNYLGTDGYCAKAKIVTDTREKLESAIDEIEGLQVWGTPQLGVICFGSTRFDVNALWGKLFERGWFLSLTNEPKGPAHDVDPGSRAIHRSTHC